MAKGDNKKQEEILPPLNDGNWNVFIFVIYLDAGTAETNAAKLSALADWVASGHRQRFTTVSRADIVDWAIENAKSNDACKDLKATLDGGATEITVSDSIMARAVKSWLLSQKDEGLEAKTGKNKEAAGIEPDDKGKGKNPKDAAAVAKKPPAAAPVKGSKVDTSPTASAGSDSRKKVKLRERTGGPQKDRITAIGDEPLDGPDCYYYFRDLDSASFISALNEEVEVSVDVAFRGVYDPNEAIGKKGEKDKTDEQMTNPVWTAIRNRARQSLVDPWRKTAWEQMKNVDFKDAKDAFELLSAKIYRLLEKRKIYDAFFKHDKTYKIQPFDKDNIDLRYYDYLTSIANSGGVTNVEIMLSLMIELIGRSAPLDDGNDQIELNSGALKQFLDAELARVGLNTTFKALDTNSEKIQNIITIEASDITGLDSFFMKSLQSINMNPVEMIKTIQGSYKSSKYVYFLEKIAEFKTMRASQIHAESVKLLTEFLKSTSFKDMDATGAEKQLLQIEFEKICNPLLEPNQVGFSAQDWKWFGALSATSILQAIEAAKIYRPEIHYKFASLPGKLLLVLKSPGPIGCLNFQTTSSINIRPKVGFSKFHDLYDATSNSLGREKASTPSSATTSYDIKDQMISIKQDISYMYPANNIIVNVTKRTLANLGKDITTKVTFSESTLQICGTSQSKNGTAYLTCRFGDGACFSISSKAGQLSIQFSDVNGLHYTLAQDGSISSQSFIKSPITTKKAQEVKRVYLPSGIVIKHFDSKTTQVLFPDGSYAVRSNGKDWVKVTRPEADQKISVETKAYNDAVEVGRDDFVSISKTENTILVEHACLTSIETVKSTSTLINSPESATVLFKATGEQEVILSEDFKVERTFLEGVTTSIKSDMTIEMLPSGDIVLKMSENGLTAPLPSERNKMEINWISGTLSLTDILGYEFLVGEDGSTSINKPAETPKFPKYSFGGRLIKEALKLDSSDSFIGNTPVLFVISPDGQDSYQLQRDSDQLRYYQSNYHQLSRIIEDEGAIQGSITYCSTKKFKADLVESDLVQYSQFTRYQPSKKADYARISQEYEDLLNRYHARNAEVKNEELGETPESALEKTKNRFPFVFGMNKEATQLAILLKYLEKEELAIDSGLHMNTQMQQLLNNAKSLKRKPVVTSTSATTEKPKPSKKKSAPYKVPMYFDSPEGKSFISTSKPTADDSLNLNLKIEKSDNMKPLTPEQTLKAEDEIALFSTPAEEFSIVKTQSQLQKVLDITALGDANHVVVKDTEKRSVIVAEQKKTIEPKPKVKKERILVLPASILGEKPGAIPNATYITREAEVRRQINTVSTAQNRKQNNNYGSAGFIVRPAVIQFGEIDITANAPPPSVSVVMTNIGLDSGRFKLKQAQNSVLVVDYKHGPVAPGMAVTFTCTLKNFKNLALGAKLDEELKVISEMEILHIPIRASVLTTVKADVRTKSL